MSLIAIVALVVAVLGSLVKFITHNKEFWAKIPVLAHYLPTAVVVLTVVAEKFTGVQTTNDVVNAALALGLLALDHFTKGKITATKA